MSTNRWQALALVLAAAALAALYSPQPAASQDDDLVQLMLLQGDSLAVRFPDPFCASNLSAGDVIEGEVAQDKIVSSLVAIAEGAPVRAKVIEVEGNGRAGKGGKLQFAFESVLATDGAEIQLSSPEPVNLEGGGKNIIVKVLTLFLIKGSDPCVGNQERFYPHIAKTSAVYVPRP